MDREQNVMPEQADVLYASPEEDEEGQVEAELLGGSDVEG